MRLALVTQEYPPETAKGGIGTQAYLKAHGLAKRGHDVHVISRSIDGKRSERMDGRVHLIRIPGFEKRMPVYTEAADWLTYSAEVSVAINELHERTPLDLLEFPEWAAEGFVYLLNRTEWNYIPVIIHLHGPLVMLARSIGWPDPASEFFRAGSFMENRCLHLADAVYSSSAHSAGWCAREYGLDSSRIPVLHTGVDTAMFSPQPESRGVHPTIVFVGKLVRNKGVVSLVEACCRLAREFPGLRLRLIGRGEEPILKEIRAMTDASACPDLLEITGFLPREKLPAQLSSAHIFAAPSPCEGGPGFMYLEAMACGLPVIACAGSGSAEVVVPDQNGLLVPPGDTGVLCQALRRLLASPGECERMGAFARAYVRQHAETQTCIDHIERLFLSVISAKP